MRLEQRVGRVDRIGQQRTVHAFHLVSAGTGEERLLFGLRERIVRAQSDIGAPDPLGSGPTASVDQVLPRDLPDVAIEIARLKALRVAAVLAGQSPTAPFENPRPLITSARLRCTRQQLGRQLLLIWTIEIEDGRGRSVATHVVATVAPLARLPSTRSELKEIVAHAEVTLSAHAGSASEGWRTRIAAATRRFVATRLERERSIQSSIDSRPQSSIQPGLFDRRAAYAQAAEHAAQAEASEAIAGRISILESMGNLNVVNRPRLHLVLVP
jgi:hypothetical protein